MGNKSNQTKRMSLKLIIGCADYKTHSSFEDNCIL